VPPPPRPLPPTSPPHALRLAIAQPQHHRRVHHPQLLTTHPRHHFDPSQLPPAHRASPQSDLLSEATLGDISIEEKRGHYHRGTTLTMKLSVGVCGIPNR